MSRRPKDKARVLRKEWRQTWLGAVMILYVILGLWSVRTHVNPNEEDTGRYLRVALDIRKDGGALTFPWQCVTGAYREANLQPLYMVALAPISIRDLAYFVRAKLLTWLMGLGALLVLYWVGIRAFGDLPALLACLLLALNMTFIYHAGMVACEALLLVFFTVAWADLSEALLRGRRGLRGGVMVGLAYLTKGSGLFMLPAFGAAAVWKYRHRVFARGWLWLGGLGFLIVASPLIVRNLRVYGSPLYNENAAVIWADSWEETYRPEFKENPPSLLSYLRTHSVGHIASRMGRGMAFQAKMFVQRTMGIVGLARFRARGVSALEWLSILLATCILALGVLGVARDRKGRRSFSAFLLIGFFLFFSWYYAVGPGARFMLPVVPIVYLYAGREVAGWLQKRPVEKRKRAGPWLAGATMLLAMGAAAATGCKWRQIPESYRVAPGFYELRAWLEKNLQEGERCFLGPTGLYDFSWCSTVRGESENIPLLDSYEEFDRYARETGTRILVLAKDTLGRRPGIFQAKTVQGATGFAVRLPESWRLVARGPGFYILVRPEGTGPP